MNIGIYGGSFDPVQTEHVNIVKHAIDEFNLDRLYVVVANIQPFKQEKEQNGIHRLAMCRLAFKDVKRVRVSDFEFTTGGISYTYLTVKHFKELFPDDKLFLIIGEDSLCSFPLWSNPQLICDNAEICVCRRLNFKCKNYDFDNAVERLKADLNAKVSVMNYIGKDVSSSKNRARLAFGLTDGLFIPERALQYIVSTGIYKVEEAVKAADYLSTFRLKHTVSVTEFALNANVRFKLDERKIIIACALHDTAKHMNESSAELKSFDFSVVEDVPLPVRHQYYGAFVAQTVFGVNDEEILDAIRYHASGKENMSELGKLVFLSDLLECGRTYADVDELRRQFEINGLDDSMRVCLESLMRYLATTNSFIYPLSLTALTYYRKLTGRL